MTDLPDRIFEAIAEVARNAAELKALQPTQMRIGLSTSDGRSITVTSDPDDDLRRCEADKRTVERHAPEAVRDIGGDSWNAGFARGLYRALERLAEGYGLAEQQEDQP